MTFWTIVALMTGLGVAVLVFVLLRKRPEITDNLRAQNLILAREKLAELDQERAAGNLDEETYAQAREELETGLLEDTEGEDAVARVRPASARAAAVAIVLLVPLLSIGLYMKLGAPQLLGMNGVPGAPSPHQANGKAMSMEEALAKLEQKLKENPEDAEGWFMLGRVYQSMNRYADAVKAYEKLAALTDNHPQALIALADSLAMVQGGKLSGRPYELVRQALDKAPDDPTALWLAGQGALEGGDYQNAIYYWRQAEAGLAEKPDYVQELRSLILQAKTAAAKAGVTVEDPGSAVAITGTDMPTQQPASAGSGISLKIRLSPELKDKTSPGDRLFVFAKQVGGRPMPVAAIRLTAGDLPAELTLDDSNMLQPGSKLSDYPQLKLAARIAKGNQPMASRGDLQSAEVVVDVNSGKPVELVIDQVVP
ncbi:c-type cytochrome biogenesis protein CcmI [Thiolapillus brandeum]|uniref:Cytochrome c-type biogenesis protein CcmI n=1 Tax=Thiolapillus brandeum TaxID=1076588 RepID=A0A7U6GH04_9GAMM|nr:c-type cytochrome biogenesis protein CcmI [Thiolapillus brandeum]BAO43472.1 cytochrome c-type biogenesis protein CcmI [Thiolapillus brandeum]